LASEEDIARIASLFRGSEEAHGTFDPDLRPRTVGTKIEIKTSARTLREPVTLEHWAQHLEGKRPLGCIPLRPDDTVVWGAIDVDVYTINLTELVERIRTVDFPLVTTRSKSGGAHLFRFVPEPVSASEMIAHLNELRVELGLGACEVFPKQVSLIRERGDLGNWIIMPYFGERGAGVKATGLDMTLREFLDVAERQRASIASVVKPRKVADFDGPPCLQHLMAAGFPEGTRNNGLFALGVYAKKKWPDKWRQHLEQLNHAHFDPPLPAQEVTGLEKSLDRRDYNYRCSDVPIVNHCNSAVCRTRRYGVGDPDSLPSISGLAVLDTEPPLWFVDIESKRLELSTEELRNYQMFHRACMERLHVCYRLMSQPAWLKVVAEAMETLTRMEAPSEASLQGEFFELLEDFCTNRQRGTRIEDLLRGAPWEDQGHHYFTLKDLMRHLDRHGLRELTRPQVTTRIRRLGGDQKTLTIKGKAMSCWWIPSTQLSPPVPLEPPPLVEEPI
jgi:hypothetical protein